MDSRSDVAVLEIFGSARPLDAVDGTCPLCRPSIRPALPDCVKGAAQARRSGWMCREHLHSYAKLPHASVHVTLVAMEQVESWRRHLGAGSSSRPPPGEKFRGVDTWLGIPKLSCVTQPHLQFATQQ